MTDLTARELVERTLGEDVQAVSLIDDEQLRHWADCLTQVVEDTHLSLMGADAWMTPRLTRILRNVDEVRRAIAGVLRV